VTAANQRPERARERGSQGANKRIWFAVPEDGKPYVLCLRI
jgi:hypothetical protein